jgi:hypothetical protein
MLIDKALITAFLVLPKGFFEPGCVVIKLLISRYWVSATGCVDDEGAIGRAQPTTIEPNFAANKVDPCRYLSLS